MGYGDPESKWAVATVLASALASLLARQQDAVGLAIAQRGDVAVLPARSSPGHLSAIMERLAEVEPSGPTDLGRLADALAEKIRRRSLVVLFSDLFDGDPEGLRRLLVLRAQQNDLCLFHLLDRTELAFPFEDPTLFLSMEDARRLEANPRELRTGYLQELKAFLETTRRLTRERDCDYQLVATDEPLEVRAGPVPLPSGSPKHRCIDAHAPVRDLRGVVSFEHPLLALGAFAALIPPLLHLFDRRKARPQPFAAMEFLLRAKRAGARSLRLRRILLMAARMALLAAVPLALARPHRIAKAAAAATVQGGPRATVLLLDASGSMRYRRGGGTLFREAQEAARRRLQDLEGEEPAAVQIARPGERRHPCSGSIRLAARTAIDQAQPSAEPADIGLCLDAAAQVLAQNELPAKRIIVFTDLTVADWDLTRPVPEIPTKQGTAKPEVDVEDVARGPLPNLSILGPLPSTFSGGGTARLPALLPRPQLRRIGGAEPSGLLEGRRRYRGPRLRGRGRDGLGTQGARRDLRSRKRGQRPGRASAGCARRGRRPSVRAHRSEAGARAHRGRGSEQPALPR